MDSEVAVGEENSAGDRRFLCGWASSGGRREAGVDGVLVLVGVFEEVDAEELTWDKWGSAVESD